MNNSTKPLPGIEHIVVLMLENRSFDNMLGGLGSLYPNGNDFNGVPKDWNNPNTDHEPVFAWHEEHGKATYTTDPDPGESFPDMTHQLFGYHKDDLGLWQPNKPVGVPNMKGFCINYKHNHEFEGNQLNVMHYFNPLNIPVSSLLGLSYGVSDAWFASAPNQTYPNRLFAHCATPGLKNHDHSYVEDVEYFHLHLIPPNVNKAYGVIQDDSIFYAIDQQYPGGGAENWKIYYHDSPLSALVSYVNDNWGANKTPCDSRSSQVVHFDDSDCGQGNPTSATFAEDVEGDKLPKYAFIEPRYYSNWSRNNLAPNSNHPGKSSLSFAGTDIIHNGDINSSGSNNDKSINVLKGEDLLLDVYTKLSSNREVFDKTLLIVTYDEHGGMFDHVPPPNAVSPFKQPELVKNFQYDRYGVRVPTLFINPNIAANTVFRAPHDSPIPLDHTSIIKTLFGQFGERGKLGNFSHLTPRDKSAPDLSGLVSGNLKRTDLPIPADLKDKLENLRKNG